jgi:hypothetical protein
MTLFSAAAVTALEPSLNILSIGLYSFLTEVQFDVATTGNRAPALMLSVLRQLATDNPDIVFCNAVANHIDIDQFPSSKAAFDELFSTSKHNGKLSCCFEIRPGQKSFHSIKIGVWDILQRYKIWFRKSPGPLKRQRAQDTPPRKSLVSVGRAAEKALARIRKHAKVERTKFLRAHRERLALRVTTKDTDVEDAIKTIDKQLDDTRMYGRIQAAVKPKTAAALIKVELVDETAHFRPDTGARTTVRKVQTIDTKKELEAAIIERNQRHFVQAKGTPFTRSPLN